MILTLVALAVPACAQRRAAPAAPAPVEAPSEWHGIGSYWELRAWEQGRGYFDPFHLTPILSGPESKDENVVRADGTSPAATTRLGAAVPQPTKRLDPLPARPEKTGTVAKLKKWIRAAKDQAVLQPPMSNPPIVPHRDLEEEAAEAGKRFDRNGEASAAADPAPDEAPGLGTVDVPAAAPEPITVRVLPAPTNERGTEAAPTSRFYVTLASPNEADPLSFMKRAVGELERGADFKLERALGYRRGRTGPVIVVLGQVPSGALDRVRGVPYVAGLEAAPDMRDAVASLHPNRLTGDVDRALALAGLGAAIALAPAAFLLLAILSR